MCYIKGIIVFQSIRNIPIYEGDARLVRDLPATGEDNTVLLQSHGQLDHHFYGQSILTDSWIGQARVFDVRNLSDVKSVEELRFASSAPMECSNREKKS